MNAVPQLTIRLSVDPSLQRELRVLQRGTMEQVETMRQKLRLVEAAHSAMNCNDPGCEASRMIVAHQQMIDRILHLNAFLESACSAIAAAETAIRESN